MIEMIAGVYGLPVETPNGRLRVKAMGPEQSPFSLDAGKEARLVAQGVARYVGSQLPQPTGAEPTTGMTAKELRELGRERGLSFRPGMTKAEMVTALQDQLTQPAVLEPEPQQDPAGEDVPTFDAAEAVE